MRDVDVDTAKTKPETHTLLSAKEVVSRLSHAKSCQEAVVKIPPGAECCEEEPEDQRIATLVRDD